MPRRFLLHARPDSPIIERVRATAGEPIALITKDWVAPIRIVPSIQFFPESRELIEGEDAIDAYLESIRPRPMARERIVVPPIKTRVEATSDAKPPEATSDAKAPEAASDAKAPKTISVKPKPVPRKKKPATK